jgi:hypothetical protein
MARSVIARDLGLQAREVGQLVQALDVDDGGVHVGHQQALAAAGERLEAPVQSGSPSAPAAARGPREVVRLEDQSTTRIPPHRSCATPCPAAPTLANTSR